MMLFHMKMFEPELPIAVNKSVGYESVLKHSHSFVELVYIENGEGTQKLSTGEKMTLRKGDVFIIADDTQHSIRPNCEESEFRIINILFEKEEISVDYRLFNPIQAKNFPANHPIVRYIYNCLEEYEKKTGAYELRVKGWIHLILSEYINFEADKREDKKRAAGADYVRDAIEYIHENYDKKLTLAIIAENVGITSGYLQRLFRENCKTSVIEYLLRYRMECACKMLVEGNASVQEISLRIGFSDVKNFYYRFKRIFGITPIQYRQTHRGTQGKDDK